MSTSFPFFHQSCSPLFCSPEKWSLFNFLDAFNVEHFDIIDEESLMNDVIIEVFSVTVSFSHKLFSSGYFVIKISLISPS